MAAPIVEEAKLISEALSTVKIQVQQMKRHLVRAAAFMSLVGVRAMRLANLLVGCPGIGPTYGRPEECQLDVG